MNYSIHETRDNQYFKYGIQVLKSMIDFHNVRRWFTETYGVGDDIGRDEPLTNRHWAFQIHYPTYMIYIKGDEELAWFKIKHGDSA